MTRLLTVVLLCLAMAACRHGAGVGDSDFCDSLYQPAYATGFEILGSKDGNSVMIEAAGTEGRPALVLLRDGEDKGYDGEPASVVRGEARRLVCMSSTQVAMLDALGATDRIVGVSGLQYISNKDVHQRDVADVGPMENVDYERLVALEPDLVLLYGIGGASPMQSKLDELQIPYFYIDEYSEQSPLGKAEWLVAIGEITGLGDRARNRFGEIEQAYHQVAARASAAGASGRGKSPSVMVNMPYNGVWYMPSQQSNLVTMIKDAGGSYTYPNNSADSEPVDIEKACHLAADADVWINADGVADMAALRSMVPQFADSPAVAARRVWASDRRSTPGRGNDYYESAVVRPDIVLRDLYHIFYPDLTPDYTPYYYRQLN